MKLPARKANHISKSVFKAHSLELFRKIEKEGTPIIITDHGKPTLEIRRYQSSSQPSSFDLLRGSVLRFKDPTDPVGEDDWSGMQ